MCRFSPFAKQCAVTAAVAVNMMGQGLTVGFAAVLLPQLRAARAGEDLAVDEDTGAALAAVVGVALAAGAFLAQPVLARLGRRAANVFGAGLYVAGWLTAAGARSVAALFAARLLQGLAMGVAAAASPITIGEYAAPENRGALLATVSLAISFGVLAAHALGAVLSWRRAALACAVVSFVNLVALYHAPDTPAWLASRGRRAECRRVYRWLRGAGADLDELESMLVPPPPAPPPPAGLAARWRAALATVRRREFHRPLLIMMLLFLLNQWSGANVLAAYMPELTREIAGAEGPGLALALGLQRLASNAGAVWAIGRVRRRPVLLAASALNVASFLGTALYLRLRAVGLVPASFWAGAALMHAHVFSLATGTVPLPNVIAGEIFPLEFRAAGASTSTVFLSANLFLSVRSLPWLSSAVGVSGAYCAYGCAVLACAVGAWRWLPETRGRTLQDIEEEFRARLLSAHELASLTSLAARTDRRVSVPALV